VHRRNWVCEEHNVTFESSDKFVERIRAEHQESVSQEQIPTLTKISERPFDEMEIQQCPLCPEARRLALLKVHITEHLESISLFTLHMVNNESEEDASHHSNQDNESDDAATGNPSSREDNSEAPRSSDAVPWLENPIGMVTLSEPPNTTLIIIFVHEIFGSSEASWSEGNDPENFWLKQ